MKGYYKLCRECGRIAAWSEGGVSPPWCPVCKRSNRDAESHEIEYTGRIRNVHGVLLDDVVRTAILTGLPDLDTESRSLC